MDKLTYLAELAEGLARWVPERERQDILRYYAEYFEEAGPERETEVVAELGDPWALSSRLAVEGGYVTAEQAVCWTPKKKKKWPWVVAACAVLVVGLVSILVPAMMFLWRSNVAQSNPVATTVIDEVEFGFVNEGDATITSGIEFVEYAGGFWTVEDGSLDAFSEIDLDLGLANIMVTSGEDYTLFIDQGSDLGGYRVEWEVKKGVLKLRDGGKLGHVNITSWDELKNLFGADQRAVEIVITVPDSVPLDEIKVKTGLGDVSLSALEAKKISAETGMGDVECYEVRQVRKLELETGMGDVALGIDAPDQGAEIDLDSGMGSVEASLGCSERDCAYELETGMGNVTVNGRDYGGKAERKDGRSCKLDAESGMGDVNVYFAGN